MINWNWLEGIDNPNGHQPMINWNWLEGIDDPNGQQVMTVHTKCHHLTITTKFHQIPSRIFLANYMISTFSTDCSIQFSM